MDLRGIYESILPGDDLKAVKMKLFLFYFCVEIILKRLRILNKTEDSPNFGNLLYTES